MTNIRPQTLVGRKVSSHRLKNTNKAPSENWAEVMNRKLVKEEMKT